MNTSHYCGQWSQLFLSAWQNSHNKMFICQEITLIRSKKGFSSISSRQVSEFRWMISQEIVFVFVGCGYCCHSPQSTVAVCCCCSLHRPNHPPSPQRCCCSCHCQAGYGVALAPWASCHCPVGALSLSPPLLPSLAAVVAVGDVLRRPPRQPSSAFPFQCWWPTADKGYDTFYRIKKLKRGKTILDFYILF
jgi:hypothetical protein